MTGSYNSNSHKATRLDSHPTTAERDRIYYDFIHRAGCGPFKQISISGRAPWKVSITQRGTETNEHTIRAVTGSFEFVSRSQAAGKAKELIENYLKNASAHGRIEEDAAISDDWVYRLLSWVIAEDGQDISLVQ